jgi:flagellar basal-body rod protein FlgB
MAGTILPLFGALSDKMRWHQTRQGLLAENIANAETPRFRGRDLTPFSIDDGTMPRQSSVATLTTNSMHIVADGVEPQNFNARALNNFEVTPEGNGITLEDEMMKVTNNQMDFQAVTTLYNRSVRLLRTALGRSA